MTDFEGRAVRGAERGATTEDFPLFHTVQKREIRRALTVECKTASGLCTRGPRQIREYKAHSDGSCLRLAKAPRRGEDRRKCLSRLFDSLVIGLVFALAKVGNTQYNALAVVY